MPCVRISDSRGGYLSFDMREVLNTLESVGPTLHWYLLSLEARSRPNANFSMKVLDQEIERGKHGKLLTWAQLKELASQLIQTTNCVLVGHPPGKEAPQLPLEATCHGDEVVIVAFDSTYWIVCVPQSEIIQQLQKVFHDTRLVESIDVA